MIYDRRTTKQTNIRSKGNENERESNYTFLYFRKKDSFLRFGRSIESQGDEGKTNERAEKFVISTLVGLYGNIRDLAWYIRRL